jgi:hypothetical protein
MEIQDKAGISRNFDGREDGNHMSQLVSAIPGGKHMTLTGTGSLQVGLDEGYLVPTLSAMSDGTVCIADVRISGWDAWLAGASYTANSGCAELEGDGVCPSQCALLPGARALLLPGVWHTSAHLPWYGSAHVVKAWEHYLTW